MKTEKQAVSNFNLTFQYTVKSDRARDRASSYLGLVVLLLLSPSGKELDKKKGEKCKNMKTYKSIGEKSNHVYNTIDEHMD